MKQFASFLLAFLIKTALFGQPAQAFNTELLGKWSDPATPIYASFGMKYNSCWAWADGGREFAALGATDAIHFFEVTGGSIKKLKTFQGTTVTAWREFKNIDKRIYAVCDACSEGLMIFDISNPDDIQRTYFSNALFDSSHSLMFDTTSKRIYLNGSDVAHSGIAVLDVSQNPDEPALLATTDLMLPGNLGGYVHDSYVRNDTVFASHGYKGMVVWDFKSNPQQPISIASINTGGYNHQSWMTLDGRFLAYAEELPQGQPLRILDLSKLAQNELSIAAEWKMPLLAPAHEDVTYHNLYIKDNLLYVASYLDGLQIFDITDPKAPKRAAYFDTHVDHADYLYKSSTISGGKTPYAGCWGAYPWLPSGNLVASDMQSGLFLIKPTIGSVGTAEAKKLDFQVSPNPASASFSFFFGEKGAVSGQFSLLDFAGKVVKTGVFENENNLRVSTDGLAEGLYFLNLKSSDGETAVSKIAVLAH